MSRVLGSVAVFCGSNIGRSDEYALGAEALGRALALSGITLVYGGTHNGLMGVLCDAVLTNGGQVHGVITEDLRQRGHIHPDLSRHEVASTLRIRKERMVALADAFIALPGGIGTMDELLDVWSMTQLGEIDKPVGLLNSAGFFSPFLAFLDHMVAARFLPQGHRDTISVAADASALLAKLRVNPGVKTPKTV